MQQIHELSFGICGTYWPFETVPQASPGGFNKQKQIWLELFWCQRTVLSSEHSFCLSGIRCFCSYIHGDALWQPYKILPNILKGYFSKKGWNSFCPLLFPFGLQCPNYNRLAAFQCFIKTSLCISLKSVRHSLFLFLSSCLWRELWETWSVLFYFHRVHMVLFLLFLPIALYSVRERVSHRGLVGFHMEGGKLWATWHVVFYMWYFVLQPQTCSQKNSAFCSKELKLPCNREGFVSTRQIHLGEILRSRSSRYSASHNLVLQQ